jgi:hypothetical protein
VLLLLSIPADPNVGEEENKQEQEEEEEEEEESETQKSIRA